MRELFGHPNFLLETGVGAVAGMRKPEEEKMPSFNSSAGHGQYYSYEDGNDGFPNDEPPDVPYDPEGWEMWNPETWPGDLTEFKTWANWMFDFDAIAQQNAIMDLLSSTNAISGMGGMSGDFNPKEQIAFWQWFFGLDDLPPDIIIPPHG